MRFIEGSGLREVLIDLYRSLDEQLAHNFFDAVSDLSGGG